MRAMTDMLDLDDVLDARGFDQHDSDDLDSRWLHLPSGYSVRVEQDMQHDETLIAVLDGNGTTLTSSAHDFGTPNVMLAATIDAASHWAAHSAGRLCVLCKYGSEHAAHQIRV
jgi:hypothetical protein